MIYPVQYLSDIFVESVICDEAKQKYFVLGHLDRGDMFGEQSALNDLPNPYTVVAATPKVEYYKIHRSNLISYFGGAQGEPVNQMRASIILRNNWLCTKILQLECMDISDLWKLEYCNDHDLNKNKPTK
jgi:hypothetical protein